MLFQFVEPPPPPSKLQLPVALRRGVMQRMEWPFVSSLLGSFAFQVIFWGYVLTQDYPEPKQELDEIPERFVSILDESKPEEKPPEVEDEEDEAEDDKGKMRRWRRSLAKPEPVPVPTPQVVKNEPPPKSPEDIAREKEAKKIADQEKVQNTTLLKFLGGDTGDGSETDVGNTFNAQATETAFNGAGVKTVDESYAGKDRRADKLTKGGGKIRKGSKIGKIGGKGAASGDRGKRVKIKGIVKTQAPDEVFGDGTLDPNKIKRKIGQQRRAIQKCYEKELKKNPKLRGKIVLLITIKKNGRVGPVEVMQNSTNDRDVQRCVVRLFKKIHFPNLMAGSQSQIRSLSGSK